MVKEGCFLRRVVRGNISGKMAAKSKGRNISPVNSEGKNILDTGNSMCKKALESTGATLATFEDLREKQRARGDVRRVPA